MLQANWSSICDFTPAKNWLSSHDAAMHSTAAIVCTFTCLHLPCCLGWISRTGCGFPSYLDTVQYEQSQTSSGEMCFEESVNGSEKTLSHPALTNEAPCAIKVRLITPLMFHIQYSEYWEVWVSLETPALLLLSPLSPESLLEGCGGGGRKRKGRLGVGKKEKNDTEELFLFLTSSSASLSFRGLANGIVLLSHNEWSCFPIPRPSRVIEIGFKTRIKMFMFLWTLEPVICFSCELVRGQRWEEIKIKGAQTNLKQAFFLSL